MLVCCALWSAVATAQTRVDGHAGDAGGQGGEASRPGPPDTELRLPQLLTPVDPDYPEALPARTDGAVILQLEIDVNGNVSEATVLEQTNDAFGREAQRTALRLRFVPAQRGNKAIASRIRFRFDFRPPPMVPPAPAPHDVSAAPPSSPPRAAVPASPVEVEVRGVSQAQRVRESGQAVKVIETTEARQHSADVGEVLARTEGVAVQRSGGLGSESRLSLHGLIDDQIRFFIDGVPLELAGFGLGIANVPLGWIQRIEVHRGVVPTRLGTDALGGAIDLITDQSVHGTTATASYTAGAFDTHQLAASLRARLPAVGLLARGAAFYDTSANDYLVDTRVPDDLGRLHRARVRRFHDGYRAGGGSVEVGFVNRRWARRLLLRVFATSFDKELQHNVDMTVPYGEVTYGESTLGTTLRYEQPHLGRTAFGVSVLAGYSHRRLDFRDASRWVYDWFGQRVFERNAGSGEITRFASDLSQWENRALARAAVSFDFSRWQQIRFVTSSDYTTRTGEERLRVNPERIDPLATRRSILSLVTGLEYQARDADDRVENTVFAKHYLYRPTSDQVQVFDNSIRHVEDSVQHVGGGDALRVRATPWLLGKLSYEYATRLPHSDEVFGDGSLTLPNLDIAPETSHNANASVLLERELPRRAGALSFEPAAFVRRTEAMIVRLLAQDRVHSIHQNVFSVSTYGVDGALRWTSPRRYVTLGANATWQDQRNASESGPFAPFVGQRVPNRPWLFANGSAELRLPGVAAPNAELVLSWVTHFVHEFLPGWEDTTALDDANRIPDQLTHALGLVYTVRNPWSISCAMDVTNLTNARAFDVLGVQKPGRAAYFKLTFGWESPTKSNDAPLMKANL